MCFFGVDVILFVVYVDLDFWFLVIFYENGGSDGMVVWDGFLGVFVMYLDVFDLGFSGFGIIFFGWVISLDVEIVDVVFDCFFFLILIVDVVLYVVWVVVLLMFFVFLILLFFLLGEVLGSFLSMGGDFWGILLFGVVFLVVGVVGVFICCCW